MKKFTKGTTVNKPDALIIFTKFPHPGKVKTRLAATIGHEKAIKFFKVCAENIFNIAHGLNKSIETYLFYQSTKNLQAIKKWIGKEFTFLPQSGGDLGNKMTKAFEKVFEKGKSKAIIVGTDIPDIDSNLLRDAFKALDSHDIVIGPSYDGGYYLLGMKKFIPGLFVNIEWSTDSVYNSTVKIINNLNYNYFELPRLHDVDTEMELLNWLNTPGGNKQFKEKLRKAVFDDE